MIGKEQIEMKTQLSVFVWLSITALFAARADAALLEGKMMFARLTHQTTAADSEASAEESFTVGPGVELMGFCFREFSPPLPPLVDIDVSDNQILITLVMNQPFAVQE